MSIECYEKQIARQKLYSKLAEAISEIEHGAKGTDAEKFLKNLRGEINVPVFDRPIIDKPDDLHFEC